MEETSGWLDDLASSGQTFMEQVAGYLPHVVGALALGFIGWLVARIARVTVRSLGRRLNDLVARLPLRHPKVFTLSPAAIRLLGDFAFWLVAFLFLVGIAYILELDVVGTWLARLAGLLPQILAGGFIIVIGIAASILLGQITEATAAPVGATRSHMLGRIVQVTVLVVAIVLGIGQTGLDMTLPVALIVVAAASIAGALSLAFALGATDLARDLIGAQGLQQHCELHQRIRVDDIEGEVVDLTATSVVLATSEGRVVVPGRVFHERAILLLSPADDD